MVKKNKKKDIAPWFEKVRKWEWILLLVLVVGTFLLRVLGQLSQVFHGGEVWLREVDGYYYMRMVDNMIVNWPHPLNFDVYLAYPAGSTVGFHWFLPLIIATFAKMGLNPDLVAVWIPPIMGALLMVPIYFIGRTWFNKRVGIIAVLLAALLPTELFHRSLLGFVDHHILEAFFSTLTIMFLSLALKKGKGILLPVLAGISLTLYNLNWHGGLFFMLILGLIFIVKFIYDYYKDIYTNYFSKAFNITFAVCAIVMVPFLFSRHTLLPYYFPFLGVVAVSGGLGLMASKIKNKATFLLILTAVLGIAPLVLSIVYPNLLRFTVDALGSVFIGYGSPISETGSTTFKIAADSYGVAFILAIGGLYFTLRKVNLLIVVWALVVIVAAIGQRKWGYYLVINIALLTGIFIDEITSLIKSNVKATAMVVSVLFCLLPTSIIPRTNTATGGLNPPIVIQMASLPNNISQDWVTTLKWLAYNTPDQFGIYGEDESNVRFAVEGDKILPEAEYLKEHPYYALSSRIEPKYGILTWWDYGHWIIRESHRVPTSNNAFWGNTGMFRFYASIRPEEAEAWIKDANIKYIIVSRDLVSNLTYIGGSYLETYGKLPTVAQICNLKLPEESDYPDFQSWYTEWSGYLQSTMAFRLYTGKDVPSNYNLLYSNDTVRVYERLGN